MGIREVYYQDVLTAVYYYDDDGNIVSSTSYDYKTGTPKQHGRITHLYEYTDGYNLGSIRTNTQYYYEDDKISELPAGVTEQPHYVEQWITVPYYNENGERDGHTIIPYYGDWYEYNTEGAMVEHSWGSSGEWEKKEGYDGKGVLSYDRVKNADGTETSTSYYTAQPAGWTNFDPTGDRKTTTTYSYDENGIARVTDQQKWDLAYWHEDMYEDGVRVGYYDVYGYKRYYNMHLGDGEHYEFIESDKATRIPHYSN